MGKPRGHFVRPWLDLLPSQVIAAPIVSLPDNGVLVSLAPDSLVNLEAVNTQLAVMALVPQEHHLGPTRMYSEQLKGFSNQ